MSSSILNTTAETNLDASVGVGLRHAHYKDVLDGNAPIDFLEVHTENFFGQGGLALQVLDNVATRYPLSFHGTAMGLGSAVGIDKRYLQQLKTLVEQFNPRFVSDHASFSWVQLNGKTKHLGDLLPIAFNRKSLAVLTDNVERVQQYLGRQILVENIVSYLNLPDQTMEESEFFAELVASTQCGLLVDLNNLLVVARNENRPSPLDYAMSWLQKIPASAVLEVHLAGYTEVPDGEIIVDDHSQAISSECWQLYEFALKQFDGASTLIEWDNQLPSWENLLYEVKKARRCVANIVSGNKKGALENDIRYTAVG